jgi:hypothetical protein
LRTTVSSRGQTAVPQEQTWSQQFWSWPRKASFELSVADAWIAATALITEGHLVHKDPEFRPLTGLLSLVELPLKPSRRPRL